MRFQPLFNRISREIEKEAREKLQGLDVAEATKERQPFLIGASKAPLFVGFAIFIAEQAIKGNIQKLFFLTREGEFFQRVFRIVFPTGAIADRALPATDLLEVSRLSTFGASLSEISIQAMMSIWRLYSTQSIASLCRSLRVQPDLVAKICAEYAIPLDEPISSPWRDQRVVSLFADPSFVEMLVSQTGSDRGLLISYMQRKLDLRNAGRVGLGSTGRVGLGSTGRVGLGSTGRVGLVDIGWVGTIQDNISRLFPDISFLGIYLGLARFLNEQPVNSEKVSFGPNLNDSSKHTDFFDDLALMEMLCSSSNGSAIGYETSKAGIVAAVRSADKQENRAFFDFTTHFQEGVVFAADLWARHIAAHSISSRDLYPAAIRIWDCLSNRPPKPILDSYFKSVYDTTFGLGASIDKSFFPKTGQIFYACFSRRHRHEVMQFIRSFQKPGYVQSRDDLGPFSKLAWKMVLLCGLLYKRTLLRMIRKYRFFLPSPSSTVSPTGSKASQASQASKASQAPKESQAPQASKAIEAKGQAGRR